MKTRIFSLMALLIFLASACGGKKTSPEQKVIEEKVVYKEAVVYAGSTDFVFENEKKETVMVRISHEKNTIKIPGNMLDKAGEEGPPGANPDMVGKSFVLVKNDKGDVLEIKLE